MDIVNLFSPDHGSGTFATFCHVEAKGHPTFRAGDHKGLEYQVVEVIAEGLKATLESSSPQNINCKRIILQLKKATYFQYDVCVPVCLNAF